MARDLALVSSLAGRWIERALAGHEPPLTVPQFLALRAIAEEDVSGTDLARRAGVTGPAASQLVTALADRGLVARTPHPSDRRRTVLALSAAGAEALRSAEALAGRELAPLLDGLPHPEVDALGRALPDLIAALAGTAPPRRPPPPLPPGKRPA